MGNWYVDNAAVGLSSGVDWTNAWTELDQIGWGSVQAGDTIYISGGSVSKTYLTKCNAGKGGSLGLEIKIYPGVDPGHDGLVIVDRSDGSQGSISTNAFFLRDHMIVDGYAGTSSIVKRFKAQVCSAAVYADTRDNVHVSGVETYDTDTYPAIRLTRCTNSSIEYCKTRLAKHGSLALTGAGAALGTKTVRYNDIESDAYDGISIDSGTDCYGNFAAHVTSETASHPDGIVCQGGNNRVYLNSVQGFNQQIYIDGFSEAGASYVYSNICFRGTGGVDLVDYKGIVIDGEVYEIDVYVYNNTIIDHGINVTRRIGTLTIKNNILDTGMNVSGIIGTPTYDIDYNWYVAADSFNWQGSSYNNFTDWQTNSGQDANSFEGDPDFNDPASFEYWVKSSSGSLNKGIALVSPFDVALADEATFPEPGTETRPQGPAFDLGAYEKVGPPISVTINNLKIQGVL